MRRLNMFRAIAVALAIMLVGGLTYLLISHVYAGNDGSHAIFQLWPAMAFYANPLNLLKLENTYGLPLFKGYGILILGWLTLMMAYGWKEVPLRFRRHLILAAIINLPLFLLFCAEGEIRNLSMTFVGLVILIAGALQRWMRKQAAVATLTA
jgi:hypothetical protein